MVMIRYFERATSKQFETCCHKNIAEFLKAKNFNKEELLRMRFFKGDVLGDEVDTSDISFLHEEEGEFEIFSGIDMPLGPVLPFVPYIVGALFFVAAIALAPSIPNVNVNTDTGNSSASSTNKLGSTSNEANVNGRIDDIFGTVNYHTPPLWQVPYRIGVNNQETEVLLVCVGRGKYDINTSEIFDSYTPYTAIPLAQASIYEPGTYPGNGEPSQSVRGTVDQPIGIYRESTDLNASELLPPNDLTLGGDVEWKVTVVSGVATFTITNPDELGVNSLADYYVVGGDVVLIETEAYVELASRTLYRHYTDDEGDDIHVSHVFNNLSSAYDMSGQYEVISVDETTVTITGVTIPDVNNASLLKFYDYGLYAGVLGVISLRTTDPEFKNASTQWYLTYSGGSYSNPLGYLRSYYFNPDVGQVFDNVIGPVNIYENSSTVIINLTSSAGFYKLDGTTYKTINASVEFTIQELDPNGLPTGNSYDRTYSYNTNESSTTSSVYKSIYLDIHYGNARIYGRRLTDRDLSSGVSNVDKIEWTALYSFEPIPDGTDFGDVTLMHCVIPSNSQSRIIKSRKTNLHVTRKITEYLGNGEFGPTESYATDSAVQIMIHTALDPKIGRLTLSKINADGLLGLETEINEYYGSTDMVKFGYDFDTTQMSYEDMFMLIANVIGCYPYTQNGVYDAFFEKPQASSSLQVTCRNKIADSETREDIFYKQYDGVELTYRNNETGVSEVIYIPDDLSASNAETIEMLGCTTELQAYRRALRARNKQIYKMFNVEFDVDEFGRLIVPGSRIDSPDGTRFVRHQGNTQGYNIYQGEVVEVNGLVVELSEPVAFVDGEDHYIQFTNLTGENSELIMCTQGDDEYEIVLAETPVESIYDGYSRDKTKFTFCSEQLRESIALIPQTISSKMDGATETNTISSINYDSRYYKDDMETPS